MLTDPTTPLISTKTTTTGENNNVMIHFPKVVTGTVMTIDQTVL
jgi:hypothetical protein